MTRIKRSLVVKHSSRKMYDLVNDVERYPEFVTYCSSAEVVKSSNQEMLARLDLKKAGVNINVLTRNTLNPPFGINMLLEEGPFDLLDGRWTFQEISESASRVSLVLDYEFKSFAMHVLASNILTNIASDLVETICRRADYLYLE